jgi:DnaJ-domain-containing protein 1
VRITFWREGRGYGYEALEFADQLDNLRAAQRAITLMYQVFEVYKVSRVGVSSFDALFGGFLLLGDGSAEWWEVLGVDPRSPKEEVTRAFRRLSRETHPDVTGGDDVQFKRVVRAYDQALATIDRG